MRHRGIRLRDPVHDRGRATEMDRPRHRTKRLIKIVDFLIRADCYHGIYPHFMNGATGKTIPFGRLDDGADIVETSYLLMGLLTARQYFNHDTPLEKYFRNRVNGMWRDADWNWHSKGGNKALY